MHGNSVEEFTLNLEEEIARRLGHEYTYARDAFTHIVSEYLIEDGTLEELHIAYPRGLFGQSRMEANGYAISQQGHVLDLVVTDYGHSGQTVQRDQSRRRFRWVRNFAKYCRDRHFTNMETSTPEFDMAQTIHANWENFEKIRLFLLTDGSSSLGNPPQDSLDGVPVFHHMWDVERIRRLVTSGRHEESITINFGDLGAVLPCLPVAVPQGEYECLLTSVPGDLLAGLYDEHGAKLLQRNVRAFLQNRGKVNQKISETIQETPERFLAYNNGISATATKVEFDPSHESPHILSVHDLQIVNGGQTTASLHRASKQPGADLTNIQVPAKITIVHQDLLDELVPRISRYANSQNPINTADFEANSPFHVALERLSRSVWAPAKDGATRQTRWYYERVRAQYEEEARRTSGRSTFYQEFPKKQRISKTDAAKYDMVFRQLPHVVSLGAQKCFYFWTTETLPTLGKEPGQAYFQELVAKRIIFEQVRARIRARRYGAGYLAQVTSFTLARMVDGIPLTVVLDETWKHQDASEQLVEAAFGLSERVRAVLTNAPGSGNVSEWCKKEDCWKSVLDIEWQGL
ncbi:AIPR family protein [Nocardiopsis deserti]|uniref:AIPR family protein n=1 Tax=Nocardiopsis deserti TaxID=2605988 RepID=UPI0012394C45|nr:AIPR family protein [Nocardiopsis deserti]